MHLTPFLARRGGTARFALVLPPSLVALAAAGCSHPAAPPTNILIITVDTERQDHLELYGYGRNTAPSLRRLASDGVTFANAITPIPRTAPALATMLTGLYPRNHGLRFNLCASLAPEAVTLAEILKRRGFRTAAFVSNQVLSRYVSIPSCLDRGFDVYDDRLTKPERKRRDVSERPAEPLTEAALEWLGRDRAKPFLLWVHYIDPHGPYEPPEPHRSRFRSASTQSIEVSERTERAPGEPKNRPFLAKYNLLDDAILEVGSYDLLLHLDRYDGEIAYADAQIGRLLDGLERSGCANRTLVLYASDHGESFGEHGVYFEHGLDLYEENLRVPLVLRCEGLARRGLTISALVQLADVAPTCLDALDVPLPASLDGRSLLPLVAGLGPSPAPDVFLETRDATDVGGRFLCGLIEDDWKCVVELEPGDSPREVIPKATELYDRRRDPLEQNDRAAVESERAERMRRRIVEFAAGPSSSIAPLDLGRARMEAVGYFGGDDGPRVAGEVPRLVETLSNAPEPLLAVELETLRALDRRGFATHLRDAMLLAARRGRRENVVFLRERLHALDAEEVRAVLEATLRDDDDAPARTLAAETLAHPRYAKAAPALTRALSDADASVRLAAESALRALAEGIQDSSRRGD